MDRLEIVAPGASDEAVFSGVLQKWLLAMGMDKMFMNGGPWRHLHKDSQLSNDWGASHGPASLRDEERHITAFPDFGDEKIDRSHPGVDPPHPCPRKIRFPILGALPLHCPDFRLHLDSHQLRHHPLEHGQKGIGLRDKLQ
jgi:hypothetical protein